jgi:hypothetical protein
MILHKTPMGTPFILSFPSPYLIILLKHSTTKIKRREGGCKGHPCLRPLLDKRKGVVVPFNKTTKYIEENATHYLDNELVTKS